MPLKHPCIRNLDTFKDTGCPRNDDCPCWITSFIYVKGERLTKSQCIDLWHFDNERAMLGLLEGGQAATESLRNGLCEEDPETKQTTPKAIRMTLIKKVANERLSALPDL